MKKKEVIKLGVITVDSGLCWIGDPCYVHMDGGEKSAPKEWGETWDGFLKTLNFQRDGTQFNHDKGHPGLGVAFSTPNGDGIYEVKAKLVDGVVKKVWVEF